MPAIVYFDDDSGGYPTGSPLYRPLWFSRLLFRPRFDSWGQASASARIDGIEDATGIASHAETACGLWVLATHRLLAQSHGFGRRFLQNQGSRESCGVVRVGRTTG